MKIVILLVSLSGGGAERAMKTVAAELAKCHEVTIVAVNDLEFDEAPPLCDYQIVGRHQYDGVLATIRSIRKFRKIVKEIGPECLIVNCALPELFALFAPFEAKVVLVEHANPAWEGRKFLGFCVRSIISIRTTKIVSVSSHLKASFMLRNVDRVIENSVDSAKLIAANPIKEPASEPERSIVFIGRLINPQKRPELALRVAELSGLPIRFFGFGPELPKLQEYSKSNRINATFEGYNSSVWHEIPRFSVIIVPSLYEGDGLVVVEAIILNRPIVLMDIPDLRRFKLKEESYFSDVNEISKTLSKSSDFSEFLPPTRVRESLISKRNPRLISQQWQDLLAKL